MVCSVAAADGCLKHQMGKDTLGHRCPLPPELAFTTVKPHHTVAFTAGDLLMLPSNDHSSMGERLGFTLTAVWGTGGGWHMAGPQCHSFASPGEQLPPKQVQGCAPEEVG